MICWKTGEVGFQKIVEPSCASSHSVVFELPAPCCNTIHGRSKWSGWSGFGQTSFYDHFWNCACADNEIFALVQLHRAITHARTTPWLQRMNNQDPRKATSSVNYISFQSAHLGKRKQCPCLPICLV